MRYLARVAFAFPTQLSSGAAYSVTVAMQPSSPAQTCVVSGGSGTVAAANVTDVAVACAPTPFTVLVNQPPDAGALGLLLTDGSVMMQSANDAGVFYRLTPDANGSYVTGTWSRLSISAAPVTRPMPVRKPCWPMGGSCSSAASTTRTNTRCRSHPVD